MTFNDVESLHLGPSDNVPFNFIFKVHRFKTNGLIVVVDVYVLVMLCVAYLD